MTSKALWQTGAAGGNQRNFGPEMSDMRQVCRYRNKPAADLRREAQIRKQEGLLSFKAFSYLRFSA